MFAFMAVNIHIPNHKTNYKVFTAVMAVTVGSHIQYNYEKFDIIDDNPMDYKTGDLYF